MFTECIGAGAVEVSHVGMLSCANDGHSQTQHTAAKALESPAILAAYVLNH